MTEVAGTVKQVGQGLTQKTYSYDALGALVDIITNTAGKSKTSFQSRSSTDALRRTSRSGHGPEALLWWWRWCIVHAISIWHTDACLAACQLVNRYGIDGSIIVAKLQKDLMSLMVPHLVCIIVVTAKAGRCRKFRMRLIDASNVPERGRCRRVGCMW